MNIGTVLGGGQVLLCWWQQSMPCLQGSLRVETLLLALQKSLVFPGSVETYRHTLCLVLCALCCAVRSEKNLECFTDSLLLHLSKESSFIYIQYISPPSPQWLVNHCNLKPWLSIHADKQNKRCKYGSKEYSWVTNVFFDDFCWLQADSPVDSWTNGFVLEYNVELGSGGTYL